MQEAQASYDSVKGEADRMKNRYDEYVATAARMKREIKELHKDADLRTETYTSVHTAQLKNLNIMNKAVSRQDISMRGLARAAGSFAEMKPGSTLDEAAKKKFQ